MALLEAHCDYVMGQVGQGIASYYLCTGTLCAPAPQVIPSNQCQIMGARQVAMLQ
jgi:hypothetical protein